MGLSSFQRMSLSRSSDASPVGSFLNRLPAPARDTFLLFVRASYPPSESKPDALITFHVTQLIRHIDSQPADILAQHPELLIQRSVLSLTLEKGHSSQGRSSKAECAAIPNHSPSTGNWPLDALRVRLAGVCHAVGFGLLDCGDIAAALALFAQALELYDQANDYQDAALAEYDLGTLYVHLKEYDRAVTHLHRARERFQRSHAPAIPMTLTLNSRSAASRCVSDPVPPRTDLISALPPPASTGDGGPTRFQIFAFGSGRVVHTGQPHPIAWHSTSAKELFLFMVLNRQPWSKEQILDALWPERDWVSAAKMFHSNLYRIRQVAGPFSIQYQDGFYQISPDMEFWIDSVEFEKLTRTANHTEDSMQVIDLLSRAIGLYRGDLLQEIYSDWIEVPRAALREKYLMSLCHLAQCHARAGRLPRAMELYELVLAKDNLREDVYAALMKLYRDRGDASAACQVYRRCAEVLRSELGIKPGSATEALYEQIRGV
jgi:DNA-binding SARP family transcriptional activator